MEKRTLLAFVLSTLILLIWYSIFPPSVPPVVEPVPTEVAESAPIAGSEPTELAPTPVIDASIGESQAEIVEQELIEEPIELFIGEFEERHQLRGGTASFEFSNRGAAVTSARLEGFNDDLGDPLDLVRSLDGEGVTRPGQLMFDEVIDERLWLVETANARELVYRYRDAAIDLRKSYRLDDSGYGLEMEVLVDGVVNPEISLGSGLRDVSDDEASSRFIASGSALWITDEGELEEKPRSKVKEEIQLSETVNWAGVADSFFMRVFELDTSATGITIHPVSLELEEGKEDRVVRVDIAIDGGAISGRLLCLPKNYDLLQEINGGIEQALVFPPGFLHPISVLFLKAMQWIHGHAANWGVAIILLTVGIRVMVFPLTHTSMVSMRKMQKLQPQMKAIQERYKGKKDPESRSKMGQETMELYKVEGVNPMGGCFPILIQMPIFFALFSLVGRAIELRHQDFLWIADLSAPDPIYVLPVIMTASMWVQQKLTPQAGNAQQMKMLKMMPLIFGAMSVSFPSGLVLYWMTSNLLAIFQQKITYKMLGELPAEARAKERKDQPKAGRKTGRRSRRASEKG